MACRLAQNIGRARTPYGKSMYKKKWRNAMIKDIKEKEKVNGLEKP